MSVLSPLDYVFAVVLASSAFMLIYSLFRYPVQQDLPVHRQIAAALGGGGRSTVFEHPVMAPLMSLAITIARRFSYQPLRNKVRNDLNACGNPNGYSIDEYLAISLACSIGLLAGTLLVLGLLFFQFEPLTTLAMGLAGFYVPIWALRESARARLSRISKKLPYTLDLIALMMEAGSTFVEAIDTIIRDEPDDDFNQELAIVRSEIDFGIQRAQALRNMADRAPLESLRSIVGAVNQSEVLGTPLSAILKSQSSMLRMHRSVRAEKLSASASLRILIPSMLILGAVVIVIFGPLILRWLGGDLNWS